MIEQERYDAARAAVVAAVKEFVEAGDAAGKSPTEIQSEFIVAFTQAMAQESNV